MGVARKELDTPNSEARSQVEIHEHPGDDSFSLPVESRGPVVVEHQGQLFLDFGTEHGGGGDAAAASEDPE